MSSTRWLLWEQPDQEYKEPGANEQLEAEPFDAGEAWPEEGNPAGDFADQLDVPLHQPDDPVTSL